MADAVRLAVSNIAWEPAEDEAIAEVLRREGVSGVEIAPTKWRERPYDASVADVVAYRRYWEDRGLRVVSLQALLFGRADLELFGSAETRGRLADYLRSAIDFAALLGAHALVFGSPKNRLRRDLPLANAMQIAAEFFRPLGEYAESRGAAICIEANPVEYGCDFLTTTAEAMQLCRAVAHPGIRINVDLGGMAMVGESVAQVIADAAGLIGHVHASEPRLAELTSREEHAVAARALSAARYAGWVSVEMRASGSNPAAVARAARNAREAYQSAVAVS